MYFPKNYSREITTETYLNKFSTQESLKKHSQPKDWKEESLPKKCLKTFWTKPLWRHVFNQNLSEEECIPKKVNRNLYQKILDETCLPQTLWKELSKKQFSKETTTKKNKNPPKVPDEKTPPKIFEDKILYPNIRRRILHQTICQGKLSTKQTLNKSLFQTNSKRNLYQRMFEETCLPNIFWRRISTKKMPEEKSLPRNSFKY